MRGRTQRLWVAVTGAIFAAGWLMTVALRPASPLQADNSDLWAAAAEPRPSVTLATDLTAAGIHRRWLTIVQDRPELQAFDVGISTSNLFGFLPLHSLIVLGDTRLELNHICAALRESGYGCDHGALDRSQPFEVLAWADPELMPPLPHPAVEITELDVSSAPARTLPPVTAHTPRPVVASAEWHWLNRRAARDPSLIRILGVGDIMLGTDYPSAAWLNPDLRPGANVERILSPELVRILRGPHVTFGNVEGVLAPRNLRSSKDCSNCFSFRSPVHYAEILADAGFDMVSLANNHSGDFGSAGRRSTIEALTSNGIDVAGLDQDDARVAVRVLEDGRTVGLIAFAPNVGTLDLRDTQSARLRVEALAAEVDILVVSFHGGAEGVEQTRVPFRSEEYYGEDRGNVHAFAHTMVDAGADVVFGHGPHVPRAVEIYQDRFIAYSLGNFWTYTGFLNWGLLGLGPMAEVAVYPDGQLAGFAIHSTRQAGHGVPQLDDRREAEGFVLDRTRRDFPETFQRLEDLEEELSANDAPQPLYAFGN